MVAGAPELRASEVPRLHSETTCRKERLCNPSAQARGHISIVPGPRNKDPASQIWTMRVDPTEREPPSAWCGARASWREWVNRAPGRPALPLVHIIAHYATPRGERGRVGGPFASPESSLTGIQTRGENALRVSGRGESLG